VKKEPAVSAPAPTPAPATKSRPSTPHLLVKLGVTAVVGFFLLIVCLFLILVGSGRGFATNAGIFGTRAGLFADFNLIAEIVLLLGLMIGYALAKTKHISAHQYNQTTWVLFNVVLVVFIMLVSFFRTVIIGIPANLLRAYYAVSTVHAVLGGITVVCGLFILLRMNKLLPKFLRIKWWKNLMRFTLGMYFLVGFFGLATYVIWYVVPRDTATPVPQATATKAPTPKPVVITYSNFVITPSDNTIAVGQTVTFIIQNGPHEPYADKGPDQFDSGPNLVNTTYTFKFTQAGTITLLCGYHSNMTATLHITP
jgi:plastocyanin/uncharacterized membrane protein YozB (DUF420 family)